MSSELILLIISFPCVSYGIAKQQASELFYRLVRLVQSHWYALFCIASLYFLRNKNRNNILDHRRRRAR
jgi:hypothetical protein